MDNLKTMLTSVQEILAAFTVIFLAEFADKTMLATVSLALLSKKPLHIVLVSTLAFTLANIVVILCAYILRLIIEQQILFIVSSILFILFGLFYLKFKPRETRQIMYESAVPAFILVFTSELGDKTQLSILAMALSFSSILNVFIGSVLGYFALNMLTVLVLSKYVKVRLRKLARIIGLFFITIGILSLAYLLLK